MMRLFQTVLHFPDGSKSKELQIHASNRQDALFRAGQIGGFNWSKQETKETPLPTPEQIKQISLAMRGQRV